MTGTWSSEPAEINLWLQAAELDMRLRQEAERAGKPGSIRLAGLANLLRESRIIQGLACMCIEEEGLLALATEEGIEHLITRY